MVEEPPRLYLITPAIVDAAGFAPALAAAVGAADVACVLLRVASKDQSEVKKIVRTLLPLAQGHGAACLVEDPQIASRAGADGAHVAGLGDELATALESLKPDRIVGVGAIANRDDAMRAGEGDVDYLMFGGPEDGQSFAEIRERVNWWAEIFTVPCVGYASNFDEIAALAEAGADFVALGDVIWNDPRGVVQAMNAAVRALAGIREATE
jgi:thiamine-phosphate pyrophosphorylase